MIAAVMAATTTATIATTAGSTGSAWHRHTSSPPQCGTGWTASSDSTASSPDSSARPNSPSNQNGHDIQTLPFKLCSAQIRSPKATNQQVTATIPPGP